MRSSRGLLARVALLTAFAVLAPAAQRPASQQIYTISIGDSRHAVSSGTLWLYSYSWYGLQQIELANVVHGRSVVRLDTGRLRGELNPNPTTDGYVIALQVGEHGWFRTANLAPDAFWNNLLSEIDSLGQATASSNGDKQLVLPAPAHRRLTLLYPDGSPAADQTITLSIYLWDTNHCGFHEGLPLGTFRTDKTGTVEVTAPLVPLYLDGISYYEEVEGTGLAGPAYSNNTGLKTSPAADLILKKKWVFTDDDNEGIDAELRVVTPAGQPRSGLNVWINWRSNTCGGSDRVGETDANGIATVPLDPSTTGLELMIGGPYGPDDPAAERNSRDLTDSELRELYEKGKLTIRW